MSMCFVDVEAGVRFLTAGLRTTVANAHNSCTDFVLRCLDIGDTIGSFLRSLLGIPLSCYMDSTLKNRPRKCNETRDHSPATVLIPWSLLPHYLPCPSDNIHYKRCCGPKWINGTFGSDGPSVEVPGPAVGKKPKTSNASSKGNMQQSTKGLEEASRPEPALVKFCTLVTIHCHYDEYLALSPEINWTARRIACRPPISAFPIIHRSVSLPPQIGSKVRHIFQDEEISLLPLPKLAPSGRGFKGSGRMLLARSRASATLKQTFSGPRWP